MSEPMAIYVAPDGRRYGPSRLKGPFEPGNLLPDDVFGAVVTNLVLLARNPDAAVTITRLLAYPNGFGFDVASVVRYDPPGRYGVLAIDDPLPFEVLTVSVRFADGRYAVEEPTRREEVWLWRRNAGGGPRRYDATYWVAPLPTPGPVTFTCDWSPYGIESANAEVDGQSILDAAAQAVQLWPYTDDRPEQP